MGHKHAWKIFHSTVTVVPGQQEGHREENYPLLLKGL